MTAREEAARPTIREAPAPHPGIEALEGRVSRLDEALAEAKREAEATQKARDAATEEAARTKAELEKAVAGVARLETSLEELAAQLQGEREERLAAAEDGKMRLDAALERLRRLEEEVRTRAVAAAPATTGAVVTPPAPQASVPAPVLKPRVASSATTGRREVPQGEIPIFRVPDQDHSGPSALKRFMIKAALLGAIGGTVGITQREQVTKLADKMVNMPKKAATETGMSNIASMIRADFVDKPLPTATEFSAYLKSRTVANVDKASIDGWGTELRLDKSPVAVRSAGPDTAFDTPDDIVMELEATK